MNRRDFVLMTAAVSLAPMTLRAAPIAYRPGLVDERLAAGETVFITFRADWCTTCARQERVMKSLKDANPAYDAAITFIDLDWDRFGNGELALRLSIPRRSTLVVLHGDEELGRLVAGTSEAAIKDLMDLALGAATAA